MKSNLDKYFKTNSEEEKNGKWFHIADDDGPGFLIRAFKANNPKVKGALATHLKPFARQIELGTLELEKSQEINMKLFIGSCLADWKDVQIDGEDAPCNPENAMKLFKSLPELFDTLWKHANDFNNYKEDLGNS